MHEDVHETAQWLGKVVNGWLNYYAVPTSALALRDFVRRLEWIWLTTLRRRSQKTRTTIAHVRRLAAIYWPPVRVRHPWPDARFARQPPKVGAVCASAHVRICAGGPGQPGSLPQPWTRVRDILEGKARRVASSMRRAATVAGLSTDTRKPVDTCANYLLKYAPYLHYDRYLAAGYRIATGMVEGACRHLVRDRMDLTGARWRLTGAEAVLKLRALRGRDRLLRRPPHLGPNARPSSACALRCPGRRVGRRRQRLGLLPPRVLPPGPGPLTLLSSRRPCGAAGRLRVQTAAFRRPAATPQRTPALRRAPLPGPRRCSTEPGARWRSGSRPSPTGRRSHVARQRRTTRAADQP